MGHIYTNLGTDYDLLKDYYRGISELLNWLKDSCIKTKDGYDLLCYHGSPSKDAFKVFNDSSGYGCKSFTGFFSLNYDFAECYTNDGSNLGSGNIRPFVINSKQLFDIKNPACVNFLKNNLPNSILYSGCLINRNSFIKCLKTEKLLVNNLKLEVDNFNELKMFDLIGSRVLNSALWEHSCSLESDKQLQNKPFLSIDPQNNSVIVLDHYSKIKPKLPFKYANKRTEGFNLWSLQISFDKAVRKGIFTSSDLTDLAQGKQVNIKLSAEEFINYCSIEDAYEFIDLTNAEKQKLRSMLDNPMYSDLDFSVDITFVPQKISLDEFNQGLIGGQLLDLSDNTWKLYEDSYCLIDNQKIHIIDWLKNEGFDAIVVKEDWAVNIICFYKNMIKVITNRQPTNSDNVYETYNYSDALLDDLI